MSQLRWVERDGKMVLQYETTQRGNGFEWVDVPRVSISSKSKRQEKIDELTLHLAKDGHDYNDRLHAEAALDYLEKRMPRNYEGVGDMQFHTGYHQALSDVRLALFGEA